jgi:signal transduction histidine kinase
MAIYARDPSPIESHRVLVESTRLTVRGTVAVSLYLLAAMSIIAWWGFTAGKAAASCFIVGVSVVAVVWRRWLERVEGSCHTETDWNRLVVLLRWSVLPSAFAWAVASLEIFPTLQPLGAIAYLFALSLAFTTGASQLGAPSLVASYVAVQILALLVASAPRVMQEPMASALLVICWTLWILVAAKTRQRTVTLVSRLVRGALARRLWSERARRRVVAAETRSAAAKSRAAESRALFVARVSHELRTPLQTIISGLEVLQQRTAATSAADPKVAALLERLSRSTDQVLALSHDLADFVRWESGTLPVRRTEVDVPRLMDDIATGLSERARLRGVRLSVEHSGPQGVSHTDAARLRAIITNLLTNAIKYAPAGAVRLTTERNEHASTVITVQDNGPGLPDRVLKVLGAPWVRGDNARVQEEGFGLGLSIVLTLAQEIGVTVQIASASSGTQFRLSVPHGVTLPAGGVQP